MTRISVTRREENDARKRNTRGSAVDYEQFVKDYMTVYKEGGSRWDLARKLDVSYETISGRCERLKNQGIKLPLLAKKVTMTKQKVNKLATIVAEMADDLPLPAVSKLKKPPVF